MDIIGTLNRISKEITDKINSPNRGGCAVVAATVATKLAKYIPVEVVVETFYGVPMDLDDIVSGQDLNKIKTARDWYIKTEFDFEHILLKMDIDGETYLFDSNGLVPMEGSYITLHDGTFPLEETVKISNSEIGWNWVFDRRQIPDIQKIVDNAFEQLSPLEA